MFYTLGFLGFITLSITEIIHDCVYVNATLLVSPHVYMLCLALA